MRSGTTTPGVRFLDENGDPYGIKQANNKARVSSTPYLYDVAVGNIAGKVSRRAIGYNQNVGAAIEDLAEQGGIINRPTVATAMQIDGASAVDTGVVGYTSTATGGSTVTLEDTAQDFTAGVIVIPGDLVLLDDDGAFGIVTGVAPTVLTCAAGFEGAVPENGDNYRVIDRSAGGLGAQVVQVEGLDAGYGERTEFVVTNGIGTRACVYTYLRINMFRTIYTGGNETGAGTILLEDQATGIVTYAQISAAANMMLQALYTVPVGKTLYITDLRGGALGGAPVRLFLRATVDYTARVYLPDVFQFQDVILAWDSYQSIVYPSPLKMPARTDIKVSAVGTAAVPECAGSFGWWTEDE